jgi:hypothetical protein
MGLVMSDERCIHLSTMFESNTLLLRIGLGENDIISIGNGLGSDDMVAAITRSSFRSNRIGNRGVVSLESFFRMSSTLQELDLSKNQNGSRGATSTLHAFRDNVNADIKMINLAHNETSEPNDGSFFALNNTLQLLYLKGNFIHEGIV